MPEHLLLLLFFQICLIVAFSRAVGWLFVRAGQPQVVGEMLAGILLGPSLLGWMAPGVSAGLFPAATMPYLSFLSQLGVVCFLFLVGLELNPKLLRDRGHAAVIISHMSIVAPFLLGAALALYLFPRLFQETPAMSFRAVALFMGAAMSITAFPVLARILTERNLHKTNVGALAITCAAVDDVTAWCMLAFVVAFARFSGVKSAVMTAVLAAVYVVVMFFVVRPFARRLESLHERQGRLGQGVMAVILLMALASACVTEWIGIHALFGAFLMGAMMPKGTRFVREVTEKIEDYTVILLLPIFFAYSGLRTQIGLLNTPALWADAAIITLVACAGKFGGSALAARLCGMSWRDSGAIGILMNTRGLMELVILNIGKDLGVISEAVFAMMILMAVVTTAATQPFLNLIYPVKLAVEQMAMRRKRGLFSVMIPVASPNSAAALARVAAAVMGKGADRGSLYALSLLRPVEHDAFESAAGDTSTPQSEALRLFTTQARAQDLPVETLAFPSADVPHDIVATAAARQADLVLMGFHKPVWGRALLGGTVHHVMSDCPCDVGVFVDRGFTSPNKILVPYGSGGPHDRLALELASRIAKNTNAAVTVLYVAPPSPSASARTETARQTVDQVFPSPQTALEFKSVQDSSPVAVVLREAARFDLVLVGVSEEWGLEARLFGWRPERIARDCPTSLLILRKDQTHPAAETTQEDLPIPDRLAPTGA